MKYPRIKNAIKAQFLSLMQDKTTGFLPKMKEDPRDHIADNLGLFRYEKAHTDWSIFDGHILDQQPHNTCVFFSRAQGASYQNGIHLSARWLVIVAYRNRWLSGNGWSNQEVGNKIGNKIGYIPEYELPSDTHLFNSWKEYVTISDLEYNRLIKIAEKFKTSEYRKIRSEDIAYQALDTGHALFVAYNWTSNNNNPARFGYVLPWTGVVQGGHACTLSGYKQNLKENPQTFGIRYGKNGVVWTHKLTDYETYIEDWIPLESRLEAFVKQYEGKMVKVAEHYNDPKCYVIQDGKKHHVGWGKNGEVFFKLNSQVGLAHVQKELLDEVPEGSAYPDPGK